MVSEVEVTSTTSKVVALINHLINGIEALMADCNCSEAYVVADLSNPLNLVGSDVTVYLDGCEYRPDTLFELSKLLDYGLLNGIEVREGSSGINYRILYEVVLDVILNNLITFMVSKALKTSLDGIEYMYLILFNGRALLLEGDVDRITIPKVSTSFTIHTHRYDCVPSVSDLKTAIEVLFDGGLGIGVVSPKCYSLILRVGPFTEDDYVTLNNLNKTLVRISSTSIGRRSLSENVVLIIG